MRLLMVMVLLVLLIVALVWTVVSFFLTARLTRNLRVITGVSMLVLFGTTAAISWFMAPPLGVEAQGQFAVGLAGVVLLVTTMASTRRIFTPARDAYHTPQPRPDTQYWSLPTGSRLAYTHFLANGTPQPYPVVYLHGGPGIPTRAANYDFFRQLTQDGYDVYLYDQAGTGLSDPLTDISEYTVTRHVADLEAIRQVLGVPQMVLFGTSWGAVLAAHYMAAYSERASQAVLISPGVLGDRREVRYDYARTASSEYKGVVLPPLRFVVAGLLARVNPAAAVNFAAEEEMRAVYERFTSNPVVEYQTNCAGYQPVDGLTRSGGSNYYVNLLTLQSLKRVADPRPALTKVKAAVLILRGECDYIPASVTQRYLDALPNATLLSIPNAGHALYAAQPELIAAVIRAFLLERPLPLPPYTASQPPARN
jgi:pimeloyl-ACP methyl ester carboxylesterase